MTGTEEKKPDKLALGCGLAAGGTFVLFGLFVLFGMLFGGSDDEGSGGAAEVMCQQFVEDRLKAPTTADFDTAHSGEGPTYTVTGTVDAENSFGAKVRSSFTCQVTYEGDERWRLDSLSGLD